MMVKCLICFLISFTFNFLSAQDIQLSFRSAHDLGFLQHSNKPNQKGEKNQYLQPVGLIVPGSLLVYSGLKPFINGIPILDSNITQDVVKKHPRFHTGLEDYVMWSPSASVYILDAFKVKTSHSFKQHLLLDAGSILITGSLGYGMRTISKHISAYKSTTTRFPSGHTANAFRGAEILHQELKELHPVWSYSGYFVAAGVGVLRIYNQEHFLTEVLAGAGLGILSTKLTYWIFNKLQIIN